jgi:hypothetical protein
MSPYIFSTGCDEQRFLSVEALAAQTNDIIRLRQADKIEFVTD